MQRAIIFSRSGLSISMESGESLSSLDNRSFYQFFSPQILTNAVDISTHFEVSTSLPERAFSQKTTRAF